MADDFEDMIAEEDARDRAVVIDLVRDIVDTEKTWKPLDRALTQMKARLKQYMLLNVNNLDTDQSGKPLVWHPDLSVGYVLTEVTGREADIVSMAQQNAARVVEMALAGALKPDWKVIDAHPGAIWKEDLKGYTFEAGKTVRLDPKKD